MAAKKKGRIAIRLMSNDKKSIYITTKNPKKPGKITLNKYNKATRQHEPHTETKMK